MPHPDRSKAPGRGVRGRPPEADEKSALFYYSREPILTLVTQVMAAYVYDMHKLSNLNLLVFSLVTGKFYSLYNGYHPLPRSQLLDQIETKFQRLSPCFRGRAI